MKITAGIKKRKNLHVVKADAVNLPFPNSYFNLTYSQGLIEHFRKKELDIIMQEQKRVTKKEGYILIDVPNSLSLYTIPKQFLIMMNKWIVPWEIQYSLKKLKNLGEDHNLKLVKSYAWGYDKLIGKRIEKVLTHFLNGSLRDFEDTKGHYFMNCIGAVFQKT